MAKRRGRKEHKKANKTCSVEKISFKTKRGRRIEFMGRPGGQEKFGGKCKNKARPRTGWQRIFAKVADKCSGKSRAKRNACVRAGLRKVEYVKMSDRSAK